MTTLRALTPDEEEFHTNHVAYFIWSPPSIIMKCSNILGTSVYCMAIERTGEVYGDRMFVQTGAREDMKLITFEIMSGEAAQVKEILLAKITKSVKEEMKRMHWWTENL